MKMAAVLKNFKTHKKLNLFKCPKFYRTNCDLLMISIFLQIFLLLVTVINCSEFRLISSRSKHRDGSDVSNDSNSQIIGSRDNSSRTEMLTRLSSIGLNSANESHPFANNNSSTINLDLLSVNKLPSVDGFSLNYSDSSFGIDTKRLIVVSNLSLNESQEVPPNFINTSSRTPNTFVSDKNDSKRLVPAVLTNRRSAKNDSSVLNSVVVKSEENSENNDESNNLNYPDGELDDENDDLDTVKFQQVIMQGLGLQSLPDASKMNISQEEYEAKYNEYLKRVEERKKRELLEHYSAEYLEEVLNPVSLYSIKHNTSDTKVYKLSTKGKQRNKRASVSNHEVVYVRFPIELDSIEVPGDIEEATLKLLLSAKHRHAKDSQRGHHHHHQAHRDNPKEDSVANDKSEHRRINLKVYQLIEPYGRVWLDTKIIELNEASAPLSQWIQLDVSKAVDGWLGGGQSNLGLEIVCENCHQHNVYIMDDTSSNSEPDFSPVLNIVGRFGLHREKRSRQHHHFMQASRRKPRKTDCVQENNKCCRHKMEVVFSEIKGYDFIIQPKTFDAGYCRGRCPPRYNPAHQHAFFQSLIWKQDKSKVPRPCCAPSKLAELEVLHVDEKNKNKLQVSTWKDMRVQECACS